MMDAFTQQSLTLWETVFSSTAEQPVELDYLLPDYEPPVFQVLRAALHPVVQSSRISGSKLVVDGVAELSVLYINEESGTLTLLEQNENFSKTVDLKQPADGAQISVLAQPGYLNCRAVNRRRIDLHGSINLRIRLLQQKTVEVLNGGEGLELHRMEADFCTHYQTVSREWSLREELEIGAGQAQISQLLHYRAVPMLEECRTAADQLILKGTVSLQLLTACVEHPKHPQRLEFELPFGQVVDLPGLQEGDAVLCRLETLRFDVDLQTDDQGGCSRFTVEVGLCARAEAAKNETLSLVDDAYLLKHPSTLQTQPVTRRTLLQSLSGMQTTEGMLRLSAVSLTEVFGLLCGEPQFVWQQEGNALKVSGSLPVTVLGQDTEELPQAIEQTVPFEWVVLSDCPTESLEWEPQLTLVRSGFRLCSAQEVEVRLEFLLSGMLFTRTPVTVVQTLSPGEEALPHRAALTLYYAQPGESLWQIAKQYHASLSAVLAENKLEGETLKQPQMLLIPNPG